MIRGPLAAAEAAISADQAAADPAIWITRVPDAEVLARARVLQAEGRRGRPLWGLTVAVKDNIDAAGLPTTAACPGFARIPAVSAPSVQRLLDAGALLLGKTNLDQFATGLVGVRSPYGTPRNVFSAAHVPGGSSSGSAVAVAAGIADFALGTDTAGSGRVPAAFGDIVGLKPTLGAISAIGTVPACRSLDTISIFAHTVDAALAVQRAIAGYDPADPYSRPEPPGYLRRAALPPAARIAVADIDALCEPEVARLYRRAATLFSTETTDLAPFLEIARLLYDGPWLAERTAALRHVIVTRPEIIHPVTRAIVEAGLTRLTVDAFDAFHALARVRRLAANLFERCDALLVPTAPYCPTLAELASDPFGPNARLGTFTNFANLCDLAAIAVPAGFGSDGLPVGVTVLGPAWSEGRLAAFADRIHRGFTQGLAPQASSGGRATPAPVDEPARPALTNGPGTDEPGVDEARTNEPGANGPGTDEPGVNEARTNEARASQARDNEPGADEPGPDETALFCIGAHMSGLPLNAQITGLGGRFLRTSRTAQAYRLHALGDRPGMARGEPGAAIAGEVWALPTTAIGALLVRVPAPLGFGTVALEEGPCLGFLAESQAMRDAPDITTYGGWRAWLAAREPE